jgi:hypothetical protein
VTLAELAATLRATADRIDEPVAAFVAILDAKTIEWACLGHPGAVLVGPIAEIAVASGSVKATRPTGIALTDTGARALPADTLLVVASSALRGDDAERWRERLRDQAPASGRLASVLVEKAANATDDALAVVVRAR